MNTILSNAIASLQLGVEDYLDPDARRSLSAVRNISAGILLLFKERLRQLSPADSDEALLKQSIQPSRDQQGVLTFQGKGRRTVDTQQIEDRFKAMDISVDWKRLNAIISIRNDIEHYYTTVHTARLKELVADAFVVIRDFITIELGMEPVTLLGDKTWQVMLEVANVYGKEKAECVELMAGLNWNSPALEKISAHLRCTTCNSELLKPVHPYADSAQLQNFQCVSCGRLSRFDEVIEEAADEYFFAERYYWMTDGVEPPTAQCHVCGKDTFVIEEQQCIACQAELRYTECAVCYADLGPDDQSYRGLCGYHRAQAEKDD